MKRTFTAALAAITLAATALAPAAEARDHHGRGDGYYDGRGHGGYDRHYRDGRYHGRGDYYYRDRDHGDAAAAGIIGLVVGLAIGSAITQDQAPACRQQCPRGSGYYQNPRYAPQRDPYYDDGGSAYEEDYGGDPRQQCTRRERQWDRYANRYVTVDVPC